MKYPNAATGVKQILASQIIMLSASVIAVIGSLVAMLFKENSLLFIVVAIALLAVVGIYVIGYILMIVGIAHAKRDEPAFKVSLYAGIAALFITIGAGFFYGNHHYVSVLFEIALAGAQFFLVHYIIHGIMHLSEHLGRQDMTKKGKQIFRVIYTAIICEIIDHVLEIIFGSELGAGLALPFSVIANILKTVEYLLFLTYIVKGNQILQENNH